MGQAADAALVPEITVLRTPQVEQVGPPHLSGIIRIEIRMLQSVSNGREPGGQLAVPGVHLVRPLQKRQPRRFHLFRVRELKRLLREIPAQANNIGLHAFYRKTGKIDAITYAVADRIRTPDLVLKQLRRHLLQECRRGLNQKRLRHDPVQRRKQQRKFLRIHSPLPRQRDSRSHPANKEVHRGETVCIVCLQQRALRKGGPVKFCRSQAVRRRRRRHIEPCVGEGHGPASQLRLQVNCGKFSKHPFQRTPLTAS